MNANDALNVIIIAAVAVWVIRRQYIARPISMRGLWVLPGILLVIGVVSVSHLHDLSAGSPYLAADLGTITVLSLVRGLTVRIFSQNGVAWRKGTMVTIALWVVAIAARVVIGILAARAGYGNLTSASLELALGVALLAQNVVVAWRTLQAGLPFAADTRGSGPSLG